MFPISCKNYFFFVTGLILFTIFGSSCKSSNDRILLYPKDVENYTNYRWLEDSTKFPLTGNISVSSKPYMLKKGKYTLQFKAYGTKAQNRLPHLIVGFGPYELKTLDIELRPTLYLINFELPDQVTDKFIFTFNDDYNSPKEDRNVYIFFPVIVRKY